MSGNPSLQKIFGTDNSPPTSPNETPKLNHLRRLLHNLSVNLSVRSSTPHLSHKHVDLLKGFMRKRFSKRIEVDICSNLFCL